MAGEIDHRAAELLMAAATAIGSGSSRIAAYRMGLDFWGCEIDAGYYRSQEERFRRECLGVERVGDREVIQGSLFQ